MSEVIANNGGIAAHYEYAPFGALTVQSGESAAANPWRFSSEFADDELGCDYYNYREYEPMTGRLMNRDPVDIADCLPIYVFCLNHTSAVDSHGLTVVFDVKPFPGAKDYYGRMFNDINSMLGLPLVSYPKYMMFFEDDSDSHFTLIRQSSDEFERHALSAAKLLCDLMKSWENFYDPWLSEMMFDTHYQQYWNRYFLIGNEGKVWRGNEINYFGIGMIEAARGSGKGLTLVCFWKILHGHSVSQGTKYLYNKGYDMYDELIKRIDLCTCKEK